MTPHDKTITRALLAERLHAEFGIPEVSAAKLVNEFFETMTQAMADEEYLRIKDFGSLKVTQRDRRPLDRLSRGEHSETNDRFRVKFSPHKKLLERISKYVGPGIE